MFDFVLGPAPPDRVVGEFEVEVLLETGLAVAGRAGHPAGKARRLADLVSAQWMTLGPAGGPGDHFVNAFEAQGLTAPKATIKSESFASSLALVEASDFLCILPKRLVVADAEAGPSSSPGGEGGIAHREGRPHAAIRRAADASRRSHGQVDPPTCQYDLAGVR